MSRCGIYRIVCTADGRVYVGQSRNMPIRRIQHWSDLRCRTHNNRRLQAAYDRHGEGAFVFEVLERLPFDRDLLCEREAAWIEAFGSLDARKGFNRRRATPALTESACRRISRRLSDTYIVNRIDGPEVVVEDLPAFCQGHDINAGSMKRVAYGFIDSCRGWQCRNRDMSREEWERLRSIRMRRPRPSYIVHRIGWEEMKVRNLARFCREQGLDYSCMKRVAVGSHEYHRGWQCRPATMSREAWLELWRSRRRFEDEWILWKDTGEEIRVRNIMKWSRERGFDSSGFRSVAYGLGRTYKGWHCRKASMSVDEWERLRRSRLKGRKSNQLTWIVWGEGIPETTVDHITRFAKGHKVSHARLIKVGNGHDLHYRGWGCRKATMSLKDWLSLCWRRKRRYRADRPTWWAAMGLDRLEAELLAELPSEAIQVAKGRPTYVRKTWILWSDTATEETVHDLGAWARERRLNPCNLVDVALGRHAHAKGWGCRPEGTSPEEWALGYLAQHPQPTRRPTPIWFRSLIARTATASQNRQDQQAAVPSGRDSSASIQQMLF